MIGLFCKRALQKRLYSAKETYNFKEPTNRSHPIFIVHVYVHWCMHVCMPIMKCNTLRLTARHRTALYVTTLRHTSPHCSTL